LSNFLLWLFRIEWAFATRKAAQLEWRRCRLACTRRVTGHQVIPDVRQADDRADDAGYQPAARNNTDMRSCGGELLQAPILKGGKPRVDLARQMVGCEVWSEVGPPG
jgi:hypothetical protein